METRALEFVWMSYRGLHLLTGSEDSYSKCSNVARLCRTDQQLFVLILWTGTWYWSFSLDTFLKSK